MYIIITKINNVFGKKNDCYHCISVKSAQSRRKLHNEKEELLISTESESVWFCPTAERVNNETDTKWEFEGKNTKTSKSQNSDMTVTDLKWYKISRTFIA